MYLGENQAQGWRFFHLCRWKSFTGSGWTKNEERLSEHVHIIGRPVQSTYLGTFKIDLNLIEWIQSHVFYSTSTWFYTNNDWKEMDEGRTGCFRQISLIRSGNKSQFSIFNFSLFFLIKLIKNYTKPYENSTKVYEKLTKSC